METRCSNRTCRTDGLGQTSRSGATSISPVAGASISCGARVSRTRSTFERCPRTVAALESWPRCEVPGCSPTAVFSILDARSRIPPHTGVNNTRLIVHLPLIVPPGCGFRVGAEQREWEPGKALIFDDTIEHEAWNDSDTLRAVLILDIWNPAVSVAERELVRTAIAGVNEFYGFSMQQGV